MSATEMLIKMNQPRQMLKAITFLPPALTFISNNFFKERIGATAENIDIDFYKGKRRLAPFVNMKVNGEVVSRDKFVTDVFKAPLIAPEKVITVEDLQTRIEGENIYEGNDSNGGERVNRRLGWYQARDLFELRESIVRRWEWMCCTLICTGKIPIKGKGVDLEIDLTPYWNYQDLTVDPANCFDNPDFDILQFLDDKRVEYSLESGHTCNTIILGRNGAKAIRNNKKWIEQQKFVQSTLGGYTPKIQQEGVLFFGNYLGMDMYIYSEQFLDDLDEKNPLVKDMIDPNLMIFTSTNAQNRIFHGLIYQVKGIGTTNIPLVPEAFIDEKAKTITNRLSSRALPAPSNMDNFITVKVTTGNLQTDGTVKALKSSGSK